MKITAFFLTTAVLLPTGVLANLDQLTWKGTFYKAVPLQKGVDQKYCDSHTPGTSIHNTKQTRTGSVVTEKGITLEHITLTIDKVDDVYLLHGELDATTSGWQDHIYYYTYKLSEAGKTKGTWYSDKCKGIYTSVVIG